MKTLTPSLLWRRACQLLASLLVIALLVACSTTLVPLKKKSTPPVSKISLQITTDDGLSQAIMANAQTTLKEMDLGETYKQQMLGQAQSLAQNVGPNTEQSIKADLINNNVGFPTADPTAAADLRLVGRLAIDPSSMWGNGVALHWELIEVRSGATVRAGIARAQADESEALSNQVMADLLSINVDAYANASGASPTFAGDAVESIDKPPASATDGENAWAVIIGIEQYRDQIPEATHARADAEVFARYVEETLGVPPTHIKLLVDERAGRADISSAIEEWLPRNAVVPGGKVYIFFSGHGAPDIETGDAYLVPYDADPSYLKTRGYALRRLYDTAGSLEDHQVMVFLDACFSGSGDRSVLAQGTRPLVPIKEEPTTTGVVSLAASAASQTTGASGASAHGLFTHHLLAGIKGAADQNKDGDITFDELSAHVSRAVAEEARLQNREQQPSLTVPDGVSPADITLVKGLR